MGGCLALISQILHYWKYYKNESPSFEMISPKSIGLINREDIIELLKRSRLIFKLSRIVAISLSFSGIGLTALTLILNSSSLVLILVEIF
jgi:hypothetical protein